jgi:hypothetical protein
MTRTCGRRGRTALSDRSRATAHDDFRDLPDSPSLRHLKLEAKRAVALDEPVNGHLRSLRLADDAVTVRELLSCTGGVDSPSSVRADSVADVAGVLGPGLVLRSR